MYYDQKESGMRIMNLGQEHGYTQKEFANRLNITVEHLCRIEMGKRKYGTKSIKKSIVKIYD